MLDREIIKVGCDEIAAVGDAECVAISFFELAIPGHSITQVIHRGSYQSCKEAIDRSEAPCGYGAIPIIKNAYGGVVTAEKYAESHKDDEHHITAFPVPGNPSMVN